MTDDKPILNYAPGPTAAQRRRRWLLVAGLVGGSVAAAGARWALSTTKVAVVQSTAVSVTISCPGEPAAPVPSSPTTGPDLKLLATTFAASTQAAAADESALILGDLRPPTAPPREYRPRIPPNPATASLATRPATSQSSFDEMPWEIRMFAFPGARPSDPPKGARRLGD